MSRVMHPRKRLCKIIKELRQIIVDTESYNQYNVYRASLDFEDVRVALKLALDTLAAWDAGNLPVFNERRERMLEYMTKNGWGREDAKP